ncbi:hypothetical protein WM46_15320 [Citrobacter freundii complex sp. CFNIH2]|uniref:hypothetical protein n=1 Tax=Citrobacter freundii complex sp. CFNIH2 TaxID=2066049 RepID=UPI000C8694AD|nr:hypothetical protein [Citrobacter freundii complex sp. CFNIH2]AUO66016.1 hypothetical protein WM46_15320 [Citrobacter freundii complex sp. CFNIH2]
MRRAWGGSATARDRVLAQLEESLRQGRIRADGALWQDGTGTFSGCAVRGGLEQYQAVTGLPPSFALLADRLAFDDDLPDAAWMRRWFKALRPGACLEVIESRLLTALLPPLAEQLHRAELPLLPARRAAFTQLTVLHRASETATPEQWQSLQADLLTLPPADGLTEWLLATLTEALCWPAGESVTALADMLPALRGLHEQLARNQSGWDASWQQREDEMNQYYEDQLFNADIDKPGKYSEQDVIALRQRIYIQLKDRYADYFQLLDDTKIYCNQQYQGLKNLLIHLLETSSEG